MAVKRKYIKRGLIVLAFAAVFIYGIAEEHFGGSSFVIEKTVINPAATVASATVKPQVLDNKININTADKELLCQLSGVGEKLADKIIKYRSEHGDFGAIEEIMNVSGIGEKLFERIREAICVK